VLIPRESLARPRRSRITFGGAGHQRQAVVYPELPRFLGVMSTVTSECSKVPESELLF